VWKYCVRPNAPLASHVGGGCRCRDSLFVLAVFGGAVSVAVDVHLEDGCVVDEAIDGGDGDGLVWKDAFPGAEGLVRGDGEAAGFVSAGDEFEEYGALGLILLGVGDVVEDQEVELVESGARGIEGEVAAGGLELLHEIGGSGVEDTEASLDQGVTDSVEDVRLAGAAVADSDQVGAAVDPVSGGEGFDPTSGHGAQSLKVEGCEDLAARQAGLDEVTLDAAGFAFGELAFRQLGKEPGGGPAFRVGVLGEGLPVGLEEAGQAQGSEHGGQRVWTLTSRLVIHGLQAACQSWRVG
jgi:hypothetical protein